MLMVASREQTTGHKPRDCPADFEATFVRIGRLACQQHYRVGRSTITRWLSEAGIDRLLGLRSAHVRSQEGWGVTNARPSRKAPPDFRVAYVQFGAFGCRKRYGAGRRTVERWIDECGRKHLEEQRNAYLGRRITRNDMASILSRAYPVRGKANFTLARHAAQFLREKRNGGWIISPAGDDLWWLGSRRRTASELVQFAVSKGFDPSVTAGLDGR